jgi:hypothetical protein
MGEREVQSLLEKLQPNMISLHKVFGKVRKMKSGGGIDTLDSKAKAINARNKRNAERAALADDATYTTLDSDEEQDDDDNDNDDDGHKRKSKGKRRKKEVKKAVATTAGGDAKRVIFICSYLLHEIGFQIFFL